MVRTWLGGKRLNVELAHETSGPNMISRASVQNETSFHPVHPSVDHRGMRWLTVDLKADWLLANKSHNCRLLSGWI